MEENIFNTNLQAEENVSEAVEEAVEAAVETPPKVFELSKKDKVFAVLLTLSSIALSAFGIFGGFNIGWTVAIILLTVLGCLYLSKNGGKMDVFSIACLLLSLSNTCIFSVTSNESVRFFGFVVSMLLNFSWFSSFVSANSSEGDLGLLGYIFRPVFTFGFGNISTTVRSIFTGEGKKSLLKVLLGICIAMPMLFIIVPLLMSSDIAFKGFADKIFGDLFEGIIKVAIGLFIGIIVVSYSLSVKKDELKPQNSVAFSGFDNTVIVSFLSVISICYLAYLFSQLAYFFSAFKGFLPEGYTFNEAEYARRGFFEMSTIAAINLLVIFAVLLLSRKNEKSLIGVASRLLSTFIGFFTLIIILTAISKMVLYIGEFGMTILRITTSAFMIFLLVVFFSLMLRLFAPNVSVLKTALVTAGIVLTLLGTVNVNRMVATYNYNAYKTEKLEELDLLTIYELGEEGVPFLVKIAKEEEGYLKIEAQRYLYYSFGELFNYEITYLGNGKIIIENVEKEYSSPEEFRFSRKAAYDAIESYLEENPDFLDEAVNNWN